MTHSSDHTPDAIILLGRGGYSSVPQAYLAQLVAPVQAAAIAPQVCGAFIDQGEPSRPMALQSCAAAGATHILIQPIAQTSCLSPCNQGPLLVVYPDGVWYGKLDEAAIDRIIEEHFLGRQVVEEQVVYGYVNEASREPTTP